MAAPPRTERAPGTMIQRSSSRLCPPLQPAPPWASLPQDLVQLIGWRVLAGDLLDYVRLRAVCAHWSSSTVPPGGRGVLDPRFHPRRWKLMRRLPEDGDGGLAGGYVRFSNLSTGASARVRLHPLLDDHVVLEPVDGLLLLYRRRDTAVRLLHPFTGDVAELPPLSTFLPSGYYTEKGFASGLPGFLRRFFAAMIVVSAAPDETITVMLALGVINRVAHATPGDRRWTLSAWALPAWLKGWVVYHDPTKL